jgi:hypothetical protein
MITKNFDNVKFRKGTESDEDLQARGAISVLNCDTKGASSHSSRAMMIRGSVTDLVIDGPRDEDFYYFNELPNACESDSPNRQ